MGDVLDQRRPNLSDGRGAEAVGPGDGEQRLLTEVVAARLSIELRQDLVVLDERCPAVDDLRASVQRVGEVAGIAQLMSVASAEALAVVTVGYSEWLLAKKTPSVCRRTSVGESV